MGGGVARVAVVCDGNFHDPDDIGATPMTLALLWRAGRQSELVHYGWASHQGASDAGMYAAMRISALGNLSGPGGFGIPMSVVKDWQSPVAAAQHLAAEIDASSAGDVLEIILAGPVEAVALAYDLADPTKTGFTHIISHHEWNEQHEHLPAHRTLDEMLASLTLPPPVTRIEDQNNHAFWPGAVSSWSWMSGMNPQLTFVLQRTIATPAPQTGDMSDAGMMWYYLTGSQTPTMAQIQTFFGLGDPV